MKRKKLKKSLLVLSLVALGLLSAAVNIYVDPTVSAKPQRTDAVRSTPRDSLIYWSSKPGEQSDSSCALEWI